MKFSLSKPPWPLRVAVFALASALVHDVHAGVSAAKGTDKAAIEALARVVAIDRLSQADASAKNLAAASAATAVQAAPRGTVYSVAQLTALIDSWRGRSLDESKTAMRAAGVIHIRGKVVRRRDSWFIEHDAGAFGARMSVSPGINVSAHEGREIVVAGRFDDWPGSLAFMREARIVADASKLEPAKLDERPGLYRKAVDVGRIRTEPGKGVSAGDIEAVMHGFFNRASAGADEPVTILLDDGWAYRRTDVPPEDLNVKASRELEPQLWGRWRKKGKDYEFQAQDDWGKARGEWTPVRGRPVPPWPKGHRLATSYESRSFYGSIGLGATSFHSVVGFERDGRFRASDSSLSTSGSMAANDAFNPTSTTASSHSDDKGTSTSVGHSSRNETLGTSVGTYGKGKRDDGADRRGTYSLSGYVLETRSDSGQVVRMLSFPWDDKGERLYMRGRTYSTVKEQAKKP